MEEFYEEDIFCPEEKEEKKEEDDTKSDSDFAIIPSLEGKSMPIRIPSKDNVSHSWTAGFNYNGRGSSMQDDDGEDEGDDYGGTPGKGIVPPHILLQRRNSGKMAFSVCVGNGRTLKGRDLTATRDSILRRTGFLEK